MNGLRSPLPELSHPSQLPTFTPLMLELGGIVSATAIMTGYPVLRVLATGLFISVTLFALGGWGRLALLLSGLALLGLGGRAQLGWPGLPLCGMGLLLGELLHVQLLALEWRWAGQSTLAALMQSQVTTADQAMAQAVAVLKQMSGADAVVVYKQVDAVTAEALLCLPNDALPARLTTPEMFAEALDQNCCLYHSRYAQVAHPDPILLAQGVKALMILPLPHRHDLRAAIVLMWQQPTTFSPHLQRWAESLVDGLGTLLNMQDTTARLERLQTRFSAMLETLPQGIVFVDETGEPGWVNQIAAEQLELPQGAVAPTAIASAMAALRMRASNQSHIAAQATHLFSPANAKIRDWEWFFEVPTPQVLSLSSTPTQNHAVSGRLWIIDDITDRRLAEVAVQQARATAEQAKGDLEQANRQLERVNQSLQRLATLDDLTQIANRRTFNEQLQREWQRLGRMHHSLTLILCDIDFFKRYNDGYGHQAGDLCLAQVAQAMAQAVHRPADLIARYGGEEFVVVLPNTREAGGIKVAQAIQDSVHALSLSHEYSDVSAQVTLSIGIAAMIPHLEVTPATLIEAADQALYEAKRQGRDRIIAVSGYKASPALATAAEEA